MPYVTIKDQQEIIYGSPLLDLNLHELERSRSWSLGLKGTKSGHDGNSHMGTPSIQFDHDP